MHGKRRHGRSILKRILIPMLCMVLVQAVILFAVMAGDNVFGQLRMNALDMLDERTQNKQQSLQATMTGSWANLDSTADAMRTILTAQLSAHDATLDDMQTDAALNADIALAAAPTLMARLRTGGTTGIFLMLCGVGVKDQPDSRAGIYLRDTDPTSNSSDDSDVMLLRGLPPVSRSLGLSLDSYWKAAFTLTDDPRCDYLNKPLAAAALGNTTVSRHCGYWSDIFTLSDDGAPAMMTYTMPLFDEDGQVYGVLGIDLLESYMTTLLNDGEFNRTTQGCYYLGVTRDGGKTFSCVVSAGATMKKHFNQETDTLTPTEYLDENSMSVVGSRSGKVLYGSVFPLNLYSTNTAYEGDRWVLIGMQDGDTLLGFSEHFAQLLVTCVAVAVVLCILIAIATGTGIARPVIRLVTQFQRSNPRAELKLDHTGISEIDTLADSIMSLTRDVAESSAKLSSILNMTGLDVGVYELQDEGDTAYCSDGFYRLFDVTGEDTTSNHLPRKACEAIMDAALTKQVDEDVWLLRRADGTERYVRIRQLRLTHSVVGAIIDASDEVAKRRRIEHERDYDMLTGILNRRAFERMASELLTDEKHQPQAAALVMMDLDNLKFLNDTYGHDCGDGYISAFAKALSHFGEDHAVVARRSGDEFYVLFYDGASREELQQRLQMIWQQVTTSTIELPDHSIYRIRASGGVSWFPEDTTDLNELIHYADFAMYRVKMASKGMLENFDRSAYTEDAFLFSAREALNRMLDDQLVHFALQPIVDAHTGETMGYEWLMRPDVPELPNPGAVLRLAKKQGMLHHIERLTWFRVLETVRRMQDAGQLAPDKRIFLNSIANQVLDATDEMRLRKDYGDLLPRVVLEVTEGEDNNMNYTRRKLAFVRGLGGQVAIDDFGTGYNSELALMLIDANYVKLDISFIRDIDSDPDKQTMVRNLISFARQRNVAILAEGVETAAEMRTLIDYGVDYMQGYYLGKPLNEPHDVSQEVYLAITRGTAPGVC